MFVRPRTVLKNSALKYFNKNQLGNGVDLSSATVKFFMKFYFKKENGERGGLN
jgi:hypothetical protein